MSFFSNFFPLSLADVLPFGPVLVIWSNNYMWHDGKFDYKYQERMHQFYTIITSHISLLDKYDEGRSSAEPELTRIFEKRERSVDELKSEVFSIPDEVIPEVQPLHSMHGMSQNAWCKLDCLYKKNCIRFENTHIIRNVVFLPVVFLSFFLGRLISKALRSQFVVPMNIFDLVTFDLNLQTRPRYPFT